MGTLVFISIYVHIFLQIIIKVVEWGQRKQRYWVANVQHVHIFLQIVIKTWRSFSCGWNCCSCGCSCSSWNGNSCTQGSKEGRGVEWETLALKTARWWRKSWSSASTETILFYKFSVSLKHLPTGSLALMSTSNIMNFINKFLWIRSKDSIIFEIFPTLKSLRQSRNCLWPRSMLFPAEI